ncbi:MAG: hypothetical protein R6V44_00555 [Paracoccaceae bacterium]
MRLPLHALAHGRSGDKGDVSNVSLIAWRAEAWETLAREVTEADVRALFRHLGATRVTRHDLPNLQAFNFVIEGTLGGGVNRSLGLDRHGKTLSYLLLEMEIEADPALLPAGSPYAPG